MICRYQELHKHEAVFKALTGLRVSEFDRLGADLLPEYEKAEKERLSRPKRVRDIGGGRNFDLTVRDQILLTVIWLRKYPTQEVLGYLFGISDTSAGRVINRPFPLQRKTGRKRNNFWFAGENNLLVKPHHRLTIGFRRAADAAFHLREQTCLCAWGRRQQTAKPRRLQRMLGGGPDSRRYKRLLFLFLILGNL